MNQNDISINMLVDIFDKTCKQISDPVIWNEITFNN